MTMRSGDIAASVIDQAFHWVVRLNSGVVTDSERAEFQGWLQASESHRHAWQRVGIVDREFATARTAVGQSRCVLDRLVKRRRDKRIKGAGTLLALVLLAGLLLGVLNQPQFVTGRGELREIALTGGARLQMDVGTVFDIDVDDGRTTVQLHRGRILVDSSAAAPADKPRIATGHGRFTPVGTRFIVEEQGDHSTLAVLQGVVAIEADAVAQQVRAGELRRVGAHGIDVATSKGFAPDGWADGVVEADDARLDDLLAELGRHRRGWLRCDPAIAGLRVTGVFRLDDTDAALHALAQSLPISVERSTDWWISVQARR